VTETVPVEAPASDSRRTIVVASTRRGWVAGQIIARCLSVWPLVALERGWGVGASATRQLWIIPLGIALGAGWWTGWGAAPRWGGERLTVSAGHLQFGGEVIDRDRVGLVDVDAAAIVVFDGDSRPIANWDARWAGWSPDRLSKALRRAGYPAAPHYEIYDGTFQAQVPGTRPRVAKSVSRR
jgi:hypothetical protein